MDSKLVISSPVLQPKPKKQDFLKTHEKKPIEIPLNRQIPVLKK